MTLRTDDRPTEVSSRFTPINVPLKKARQDFAEAVREGLCSDHKTLPPRFLYDARGSELFEDITSLPEYYPTRSEASILKTHSDDIVSSVGSPFTMVEFGSGSSAKTRMLLDAALKQQDEFYYVPIDISRDFLKESSEALLQAYPKLHIKAVSAEYFDAIGYLPVPQEKRLLLFLGSNIGNFDEDEAERFLAELSNVMRLGEKLLIGVDLAKDPSIIEPAYNDAQGVTAAFNKNILVRINGELGGKFDINTFRHEAPYLPERGRVEMRLVSTKAQKVEITKLKEVFTFEKGEYIHTENSYKYTPKAFEALAKKCGLSFSTRWTDENGWFMLALLEKRA